MKHLRIAVSLAACILSIQAVSAQRIFNAGDMGIVGDGTTKNTGAIQEAIDQISAQGGGQLVFPKGIYLTGSLQMKSGVEIHLKKGAVISGSTDPYDYEELKANSINTDNLRRDNSRLALITAYKADNIAFTGPGTIEGNGRELALAIDSLHLLGIRVDPNYTERLNRPNETFRPKLLFIAECDGVKLIDTHFRNSACWGLSFDLCSNMLMEGIDIHNRAYWNNDGTDLTDCRNVIIRNCHVDAADDGICLKSYHIDSYCDNITIENCSVISSASAIKFGTASFGGFRNITIKNIKVKDTFRSAIALESVDGGVLENVTVDGIKAVNTGNAIFIRLGQRTKDGRKSVLRNIQIRNITCQVPFGTPDLYYDLRGPLYSRSHNPWPSSITGIPGQKVENVVIENVNITFPGRASKAFAYIPSFKIKDIPEKEDSYPEYSMWGELPCWAFYVRHVDGLVFRNVKVRTEKSDFRPPFIFEDADRVVLEGVKAGKVAVNEL